MALHCCMEAVKVVRFYNQPALTALLLCRIYLAESAFAAFNLKGKHKGAAHECCCKRWVCLQRYRIWLIFFFFYGVHTGISLLCSESYREG